MPNKAPPVAKPSRSIFDPWNNSITGHQRAENRLSSSTSWRDSRTLKLQEQFAANAGGGKRLNDTVGAGSLDFGRDGRTENGGWERGAKGLRTGGQRSILDSMGTCKESEPAARPVKTEESATKPTKVVNPFTPFRREDGKIRETSWPSHHSSSPSDWLEPIDPIGTPLPPVPSIETLDGEDDAEDQSSSPQIFAHLRFYINGSTAPYSDHQVKHLLSKHGGRVSVALGRRTITHVIIGRPNSSGGCGGGLAGSKIQKEITRIRGKGVKFVTAEWVMESVKAEKRLPESRFEAMRIAPRGVGSVAKMFDAKKAAEAEPG